MSLKTCYANPTTRFRVQGEFYSWYGYRGQDYTLGQGEPVLAYESGTVGYVSRTLGLGGIVGITNDAGKASGWAHLKNIAVWTGKRVQPGDVIGYVTGWSDYPQDTGTLWDGSHIHTTIADTAYDAATGGIPLYDPLPRINAALGSSTAGNGDHELIDNTTEQDEEDDDMAKNSGFQYTRASDGAIVYLICNTVSGFISEYTDGGKGVAIGGSYNNPVAATFDTGSYAKITESHATAIKRDCAAVKSSTVTLNAPVTVNADE